MKFPIQSLDDFQKWLLVVSGCFALISAGVGLLLAIKDYRLKLRAEARAADSAKAESDVRLLQAFTELTDRANGRGGYVESEKLVEELFKHGAFSDADLKAFAAGTKKIGEIPLVYLPVGNAAQDAAIAAIATLALRHEVLKEPAIQALESAKSFHPEMAERHLKRLKP